MSGNFNEHVSREGTFSVKYDLREEVFGVKDLIPMWVADMDFKTPDFIISALRNRLDHEICGYSFRPPEYYSSIIGWIKRRHGWQIEKDWICFCPGVVPALNFCTLAFTEHGDGIIVQPPVYFPFFPAVEAHGRHLVHNNLIERNGRWEFDFDSLEKLASGGAKMIFISNPHNPVGRAWTRSELEQLTGICLKHSIIIISDEIHSDLVLPGYIHTPVASLSKEISAITVTLTAPSKTFNLAGLSTSSVIIENPQLRNRFNAITEKIHITNGNLFGTIASIAAYCYGDEWLDELLNYLSENVRLVEDYCQSFLPEITPVHPEATYMIWLDCRKTGLSGKELQKFFIKAGVGLNEGSTFGAGGEGFMRMNLGTTKATVIKALDQIKKAFAETR
ncbi:MAG TPA: PatB family C-S lyase [Bacteroidales bacterium]|nr:PatB family C-S lyase [Bacteroidales bacterium]